ncbi:hypothetical protein [Pedobacter sp. KACC 23697]|uniref:Fibronectin type-III domain-containing protein n=1 Tax=Pedobacter sp. KACC 23697 TaxID=3149230 RepID=A0AAU7K6D3_9SPHI
MIVILLSAGCKKNNPETIDPDPVNPLGAVTLSLPEQNSICTTGTVISPVQSNVELRWENVANATKYVVTVKDLLTGTNSTFTTDKNVYIATLSRNTPYAWDVTAQGVTSDKTSKSVTWKFYNAGDGVISYVPFPADHLIPAINQIVTATNGKITLSWTGSDADNDILNYDIYLGTTTSPSLFKKEVLESKLENVELTGKLTYYWKVITRDRNGNTSESDMIRFAVN